jgi:hypothetical protein
MGNGFAEMVALRAAFFLSLSCKQWVTIVAVTVIKRVQNAVAIEAPVCVRELVPQPPPALDRGLDYPPGCALVADAVAKGRNRSK